MFKAYMLGKLAPDSRRIESIFISAQSAEEHSHMATQYVEIFSREGSTYSAAWCQVQNDFLVDHKWDWCREISPWPQPIHYYASKR